MKSLTVIGLLTLLAGTAFAQTSDLIISEYVEGSGDNKAVEIYNGTEDVINLGGYTIERYSNGAVTSIAIPLDAVDLDVGEVFVLANPLATGVLLALADQTNGNLNFNGDDALVLAFNGIPVDSFGRVGEDPGSYWSCDDGNTVNHTLVRRPGVCSGDTVIDDLFDPCVEWSFQPVDTFTGIGHHNEDCGSVADDASSWGSLKATFR